MKLSIHEFDLPLRHAFTISRESHTVQPTVVVELEQDGQHGYGEATTNTYYGVTKQSLRQAIETVREQVEAYDLLSSTPDRLWSDLRLAVVDSFALCAMDQAVWDLWGKMQGRSLIELWGLAPVSIPPSCFTIGIDSIETMVAKLEEVPGWPIYKIKLGTEHDVEIIQRLREASGATFRVDANCGWDVDEALRNAKALANLGVEFIEQPLRADNWSGHRVLFEQSALPILADESCLVEDDIQRCAGNFHGVNIKLVKCGGLTPARRMINQAKELGLSVMVGCMTESTVGISAIAQLLPMLDYVDMDGAALLSEDIATGSWLDKGICQFSPLAGSGVTLLTEA